MADEVESKPLKAFSLQEIESAIAQALTNLTNADVTARISLYKEEPTAMSAFTGQQQVDISLHLTIDPEIDYGESGSLSSKP